MNKDKKLPVMIRSIIPRDRLVPLILTFVPWRTLPADEREYMKNKKHDLRMDKNMGIILLCLYAAAFLLWKFLL